MKPYLDKDILKDLKNPGYFSLVSIENGAASWPNGADIAPERLYTDCGRIAPILCSRLLARLNCRISGLRRRFRRRAGRAVEGVALGRHR